MIKWTSGYKALQLLKKANVSIQTSNEQKHHISLNSQFIVLDGIICFSVRFCDNSLLVLKMCFQVFSFASKKAQGFSSNRKIIYKTVSQFFEILIFSLDIWGNFHYVPEINLIS